MGSHLKFIVILSCCCQQATASVSFNHSALLEFYLPTMTAASLCYFVTEQNGQQRKDNL